MIIAQPGRAPEHPYAGVPAAKRAHGWLAWLAIVGLCVMAIEFVVAGLGFAAIGSGILGGSSQTFTSIALPLLVGALLVAILVIGLVRHSRVAYVIGFLLGIVPAISWAYLVVTGNSLAFELIPVLYALPAAMVVVGLALDWRAYWQPMRPTA